MTQKNNVKQLVGGSLNGYNTRVNSQIDRIQNENKRQNHMINVLNTELVKDYLTKIEEGSIISLDHSKEGMVFIDGLEGNTLVNYCTDGSKEMTLNGDIDLEGTFVTTAEGVDGGMVDVLCEGNTLVNLCGNNYNNVMIQGSGAMNNNNGTITLNSNGAYNKLYFGTYDSLPVKPNTTYTLIIDVKNMTLERKFIFGFGDVVSGINIKTYTTTSSATSNTNIAIIEVNPQYHEINSGEVTFSTILLEGDWTDKEIPPYFEGMKSVGELEDNVLELSSRNSTNEIVGSGIIGDLLSSVNGNITTGGSADNYFSSDIFEVISPNTQYYFWHKKNGIISNIDQFIYFYDENKKLINGRKQSCTSYISYSNARYFKMMIHRSGSTDITFFVTRNSIKPITIDSKTKSNSTQIQLSEPLRGLPNGVKDRFVKMGGKWYVERNCGKYVFLGDEIKSSQGSVGDTNLLYWAGCKVVLKNKNNVKYVLNDKLPHGIQGSANTTGYEGISFNGTGDNLLIDIKKTMNDANIFMKDSVIVYELETPTYELITDAELLVYLDTAHISNNSIIPCNMKVKNSGYNAIIKPNTQYTVALDANKSGTIGLNLGGSKVTTTNNVALITTPSSLIDDSLRVSGKGVKGNNVRLLEGNKSIVPYFEGMKSCFEDVGNVVNFESVNKNLFDKQYLSNKENIIEYSAYCTMKNPQKLKPNTYYTLWTPKINAPKPFVHSLGERGWTVLNIRTEKYKTNVAYDICNVFNINNRNGQHEGNTNVLRTFVTPPSGEIYWTCYDDSDSNAPKENWFTSLMEDVYLIEGRYSNFENLPNWVKEDYKEHQSNSLQFQLQEPLRKWDRFVFIDGKVMIERGSGSYTFTGNETWGDGSNTGYPTYRSFLIDNFDRYVDGKIRKPTRNDICDVLKVLYSTSFVDEFIEPHPTMSNWLLIRTHETKCKTVADLKNYLSIKKPTITYELTEPTYEEIPTELEDIILQCYENGTLFIDTIIPPTVSVRYAGETPMNATLKKTRPFIEMNTYDLNENITPYLMDMDYRVILLQIQTGHVIETYRGISNVFTMLYRDIQTGRYSPNEFRTRIVAYRTVGKITDEEFIELGELLNDQY